MLNTPNFARLIAQRLQVAEQRVQAALQLLQDGNTVPFIARYRKEVTGQLDEVQLRDIARSYEQETNLYERKCDLKACGAARFSFNWGIAEWKRQFESGKKPTEATLRRQLNAIKREQFPWMLEVTKNALQMAIIHLGQAFQNFFADRAKYPTFKKKGIHDSFTRRFCSLSCTSALGLETGRDDTAPVLYPTGVFQMHEVVVATPKRVPRAIVRHDDQPYDGGVFTLYSAGLATPNQHRSANLGWAIFGIM